MQKDLDDCAAIGLLWVRKIRFLNWDYIGMVGIGGIMFGKMEKLLGNFKH